MTSYAIRVEEDGGERRWVRAEVGEACTLGELEAWLARAFGLTPGQWTFTLAGRSVGEGASFMGPGDDPTRPGEDVEIAALAWRPGVRWIHRTNAAPFRPREIAVEGNGAGVVEGLRELERGAFGRTGGFDAERMAARVAQVAAEWQRELDAQTSPTADELRGRALLALEVARWIGRDDERQAQIEELFHGDGLWWMIDLPSSLGAAGLHERALELCAMLEFVRGETETRAESLLLLARAGREAEAVAQAQAWLSAAPDDAWARLHASDLFEVIGSRRRAREELARSAALDGDDLDLQIAALERRLAWAREEGDETAADGLEEELEQLQSMLEEETLGAQDASPFDEGRPGAEDGVQVARNEPCPCGSGMKFKRCCGSGAAEPRGDAALVLQLLEELVREADQPRNALALQQALPRFAGEALQGLSIGAALPLLPRDDLPEALVHWAVLDCDLGDGTRVIERVQKRRKRATARERELFAHLADSAPSPWRIERSADGRDARLVDLLDAAAEPLTLSGAGGLPEGAIALTRMLVLDGEPVLGPGTILLEGEGAESWLAFVRARLGELRSADPGTQWPAFLRRHAHEFYRPLTDR